MCERAMNRAEESATVAFALDVVKLFARVVKPLIEPAVVPG
jgi:hypothetical protein